MALVEECIGWDEETEAISQWQSHRDLFPHLPDRTRFNRRRGASNLTAHTLCLYINRL